MLRTHLAGWGALALLVSSTAWLVGCSSNPPPDPPPPPPAPVPDLDVVEGPAEAEDIDAGKDCVSAEAVCDLGLCTAKLRNNCEAPVTCALEVLAMCQGTTDAGEARSKSRGTVAAGEEGEISAAADCEDQAVASTIVESLSCN